MFVANRAVEELVESEPCSGTGATDQFWDLRIVNLGRHTSRSRGQPVLFHCTPFESSSIRQLGQAFARQRYLAIGRPPASRPSRGPARCAPVLIGTHGWSGNCRPCEFFYDCRIAQDNVFCPALLVFANWPTMSQGP